MVKLSAPPEAVEANDAVEAPEAVEATSGDEMIVCGIRCRQTRILLLKDLSTELNDPALQEGANIDAYVDLDNGDVWLFREGWLDPAQLSAEEFQSLEDDAPPEPETAPEATMDEPPAEPPAVMNVGDFVQLAKTNEQDGSGNEHGWEAEALQAIKAARESVAERESIYLTAKERAKDAKSAWEAAVDHLTEVIDSIHRPLPLFDRPAAKQTTIGDVTLSVDDDAPADTTPTAPTTDDAWRQTPIDELFSSVDRLGEKKQEAIRGLCPTLGAFEDLRRKASVLGLPLKECMPKGCGQAICDQLEEAALNWLQSHQGGSNGGGDA